MTMTPSNLEERCKWRLVADSYMSPSEENNKYKELYNLTPHQVFLLDFADDMGWLDLKQEKIEELETLRVFGVNRLKGAL